MTTISIVNPWTGVFIDRDISDLTEQQLDAYAMLMDDDLREELNSTITPYSPAEFLRAWAERVGPDEAGRVILGS